MNIVHLIIRKFDRGRSDFSTAIELALGAVLLALTLRILPIW